MAQFESPDLGITTDSMFSPGYVFFASAHWGLPDDTVGNVGLHVVYRPLCEGYSGHEHVTDAMRDAVRDHYARECAADEAAEQARMAAARARHERRMAVLNAIPADAAAELQAAQIANERLWAGINEGGEGYVPHIGWTSPTGREIAARHGLDADQIARDLRNLTTLEGK